MAVHLSLWKNQIIQKEAVQENAENHADYASLVYHFSRAVCVHSKLQLVRQAILRIVYLYIIRLSDVQEEVRYMNRHSAED